MHVTNFYAATNLFFFLLFYYWTIQMFGQPVICNQYANKEYMCICAHSSRCNSDRTIGSCMWAVQERTEREQVVISVHVSCKERRGPVTEYTECQAFYPLSSRPNWVPPIPSPTRECCSPLWVLACGGGGDPFPTMGQYNIISLYGPSHGGTWRTKHCRLCIN